MSGWNDWIFLEAKPHPLTHRAQEVEAAVSEELAGELQGKLRLHVDQGIDLRAGVRAQAIRVTAEGNRLVIDEQSQDAVLADGDHTRVKDIDDLFKGAARTPHVTEDGQLVFRTISLDDVLGTRDWQEGVVDRTVNEIMNERYVDAVERAVKKVELEHPTDKVG